MVVLWCDEEGKDATQRDLSVIPSVGDNVIWNNKTRPVISVSWTPQHANQDVLVIVDTGIE